MSLNLVRRATKGAPLSQQDYDGNLDKMEAATLDRAVVVEHGTDPGAARPAGAVLVIWKGTAEPANAADFDIWTGAD